MNDKNNMSSEQQSGILDKLTGNLGKVSALIIVLIAVFTGVEKLKSAVSNFIGADATDPVEYTPTELEDCFKPDLYYPKNVKFDELQDMELTLHGDNECPSTILTHITYVTSNKKLRIVPPYCDDEKNGDCWPQKSIDKGPVEWIVDPPEFMKLSDNLGGTKFRIKWQTYSTEPWEHIRTDTATITILDDDPS